MALRRSNVLCVALLAAALVACRRSPTGSGPPNGSPSGAGTARAVERGALLAGSDTFGVLAGVLAFSDPGVTGFATDLRKDRELHATLVRRGVPEGNLVLLLDAAANASAVKQRLEQTAARAPVGSTFFFYYAGHGARDAAGRPYFLAHDTAGESNALFVDDLATAIGDKFRGNRVVLMADCCYSGTLRQVADELTRHEVVVLTSADASNLSTGSWTFTQTVLDGLVGDPLADGNGDGSVTLGELADEVAQAMKHREAQRYGFFARGVPLTTPLARATARPRDVAGAPFRPGAYVRVSEGEVRRAARVRAAGAKASLVRFYDYNRAEDVSVNNAALEPSSFRRLPAGSAVSVFWGGEIWEARVLKNDGDFHFVTYPGWASYWDEWLLSDRIVDKHDLRKAGGEKVEVEWRGKWYSAVILERAGARYRVRYVGYASAWDEWVDSDRIRR